MEKAKEFVASAHARKNGKSQHAMRSRFSFLHAREEERRLGTQSTISAKFPPRTRGRTPDHRRDGSRGAVSSEAREGGRKMVHRTIFPNAAKWCIFRRCPKILILGHRPDEEL